MNWRYTTDCLTGIKHWRLYTRVGRALRAAWAPCTKAAALGSLLAVGAAAAPSPAGVGGFPAGTPIESPEFGWGAFPPLPAGGVSPWTSLTASGPVGIPGAAWANLASPEAGPSSPAETSMVRPGPPNMSVSPGQSVPVNTPEPSSLWVLLSSLGIAFLVLGAVAQLRE